ncbi:hypothetical protein CGRA01v4_01967 [Colletotrichum graminicola]|nr:hypothetical protein CGRA01v4_01967 [Colletotrichum graminicola]
MRAATILFANLAVLAGMVAAQDFSGDISSPVTGFRCCAGGTADSSGDCKFLGLNSFCCSDFDASSGIGCDDDEFFPTGHNIQALAPVSEGCSAGDSQFAVGLLDVLKSICLGFSISTISRKGYSLPRAVPACGQWCRWHRP